MNTKICQTLNSHRWRKILEESFVGKEPMKIRLDSVSHFCQSCNQLAVDKSSHEGHNSVVAVTQDQLRFPSRLLKVLDSSKKEAQFHFDPETLDVIYGALRANNVKRVVCLGAPSVHEHIKAKCDKIESILMDIDQRLAQFYPRGEDHPGEFSHYNMFNNYFFDADSRRAFKEFVQRCGSRSVTVITDPPFGGKCELIGRTLGHLKKEFSEALRVDFVWVFPYFMEPQILGAQLSLAMSDYQVRYQKGAKYKDGTGQGRSAGSPVRLFTSFKLSTLDLSAVRGKLIFCAQTRSSRKKSFTPVSRIGELLQITVMGGKFHYIYDTVEFKDAKMVLIIFRAWSYPEYR